MPIALMRHYKTPRVMFLPRSRVETLEILVSNGAQNSYGSMDGHGAVSILVVIIYPTNKLATGLTGWSSSSNTRQPAGSHGHKRFLFFCHFFLSR
jgi:hypothetical protein